MKKWILSALLLSPLWANAQSELNAQQAREGGESTVSAFEAEGLAGALRLSSDCMTQLPKGQRSLHYCLGIEAASMLLKKNQPATEDRTAQAWFEGEEVTHRVLSYCYTFKGLRGDMQCLAQVSAAKSAVEPLTNAYAASQAKRQQDLEAGSPHETAALLGRR